MEANLHRVQLGQRLVEDKDVADLGGHDDRADSFVCAAVGYSLAVGVAEEDADVDVGVGLFGEYPADSSVVGEEEAAVGEDADLPLGGLEEAEPAGAGDGRAVRIDGDDAGGAGLTVAPYLRPQLGLVIRSVVRRAAASLDRRFLWHVAGTCVRQSWTHRSIFSSKPSSTTCQF